MTRDHMGKSEFNTEARAALEDDIDRCPICDVPFKADDVCANDITEGTCHAECLEGSPVVDLEKGDEIPDSKISTYLYREVMAPRIFDESGKGAGFELTPEALVAALTIPPPQTHVTGIELAARFVEKRLNDYVQEHGSTDPETGTVEFPGNGDEYVGELQEIIDGIRDLNKEAI
ncbi:hypothetical protein [Neorhizobium sp. IRS_2294]|uniref:hypothetical protein n=1 Tax=unclassified Neorhizobium TaxID=2629175 RepID=UPI003D2C3D5C